MDRVDTFAEAPAVLLGVPPTDAAIAAGPSAALPLLLVFAASILVAAGTLRRRLP